MVKSSNISRLIFIKWLSFTCVNDVCYCYSNCCLENRLCLEIDKINLSN